MIHILDKRALEDMVFKKIFGKIRFFLSYASGGGFTALMYLLLKELIYSTLEITYAFLYPMLRLTVDSFGD